MQAMKLRRLNRTELYGIGCAYQMTTSRRAWIQAGRPVPPMPMPGMPGMPVEVDRPSPFTIVRVAERLQYGVIVYVARHGERAGVLLAGGGAVPLELDADQLVTP